jgi:hypothetical protein
MTYTSRFSARSALQAIRDPSGDQAGQTSIAGSFVRFVGAPPSAFITKISPVWVSSMRVKAIFVPSGDQAG